MLDTQTKQYNRKMQMVSKTCYIANIIYLFIHIFYLILFIIAKLNILIIVDTVVILIYFLFFIVIKKEKYFLYALLCGNEFFAFIATTTILLGFGSGFPFYLIGLCIVSFFTSYFSRVRNVRRSIIWVGLSLAIYLTLYLITEFIDPYYVIDQWLEMTLFIVHSVAVFLFITAYLVVFLKYAFSLESRIMNQSRTDELTQISNRYGLYDYFDQEEDKTSKVLALFDIDDFKNINDTYGHVAGDSILQRVAELISVTLDKAFFCRYGGEEFVIVLNEDKDVPYFDRLEKLRKIVQEEKFILDGKEIHLTITIGAALYAKGISLEKWVELADSKMYSGKNSGKNKTVV